MFLEKSTERQVPRRPDGQSVGHLGVAGVSGQPSKFFFGRWFFLLKKTKGKQKKAFVLGKRGAKYT